MQSGAVGPWSVLAHIFGYLIYKCLLCDCFSGKVSHVPVFGVSLSSPRSRQWTHSTKHAIPVRCRTEQSKFNETWLHQLRNVKFNNKTSERHEETHTINICWRSKAVDVCTVCVCIRFEVGHCTQGAFILHRFQSSSVSSIHQLNHRFHVVLLAKWNTKPPPSPLVRRPPSKLF